MKYFTLNELTYSSTAKQKGINNTPNTTIKANLINLVDNILDPLREAYGKPIIVTSGYRCTELNKAVKGASNSQHVKGEAADIRTQSDKPEDNKRLSRSGKRHSEIRQAHFRACKARFCVLADNNGAPKRP